MRKGIRKFIASRGALAVSIGAAMVLATLVVGCARSHFRKSADRDVARVLGEKANNPRWRLRLPELSVQPLPDSRLFDPGDPDHPPMPADDPASHEFMEKVYGMRGAASWRKTAEPEAARPDEWLAALPRDESGNVLLNLKTTVQIGLKNSRDFQSEREDLYLSALDVTAERFRFNAQFALGNSTGGAVTGELQSGKGNSAEQLSVLTDGSVRWVTAAGGELLASFANSLVWDYNGSTVHTAGSLLNVSLVQPLLRLGGRARVLEQLTNAERHLLANVRQMEQFQHGYYVRVTTGRNAGEGPSRSGSVGASGLGLLAGTPSGTVGVPRADGLMGLLEEQQRIKNLEANVVRLRESLDQLEAAFDAGRIPSRLQVDQARAALFSGQSSLLSTLAAYQTRLDSYKIDLGLPPTLPIVVKDPVLDGLSLSDQTTTVISRDLSDELARIRSRDVAVTKDALRAHLSTVLKLEEPFQRQLGKMHIDLDRARENLPARQQQLRRLKQRTDLAQISIEPHRLDPAKLDNKIALLEQRGPAMSKELTEAFAALRAYGTDLDGLEPEPARSKLIELTSRLSGLLLAVSLDQTAARLETFSLPPIDLSPEAAVAIARENRLDWMNARARLVDSWRQINYNANLLLPGLALTANGTMGSSGNDSARLDARNGNVRFGLRFDSPLARLLERNDYRESIIDYGRARRTFDEFEDRVNFSLRNTLRIVDLSRLNFEIRRDAVQVAISQVDLARLRLDEPPRPGVQAQFGATTARDLVSALSDLLGAQNDFLSVWVSYGVLRMLLDFELGTMELNASGLWADPGPMDEASIRKRIAAWTTLPKGKPKQETASRSSH